MKILGVEFDRIACPAVLRDRLLQARARGAQSVLVLAGDGVDWTPAQIDPWLQTLGIPVHGGVFPEVVHGRTHAPQGLVTVSLGQALQATVVEGLDRIDAGTGNGLARAWPGEDQAREQARALLVLVDALAAGAEAFVEALFEPGDRPLPAIGAGAGSLNLDGRPCLFTPQGMRADAAIVLRLEGALGVGLDAGWSDDAAPCHPEGLRVPACTGAGLIDAAARGTAQALAALGAPPAGALVVDCISRARFLGDRFGEELLAVQSGLLMAEPDAQPPFGALALGEIACAPTGMAGLQQQRFVLGAFGHA